MFRLCATDIPATVSMFSWRWNSAQNSGITVLPKFLPAISQGETSGEGLSTFEIILVARFKDVD